jgi:hypothetical protein
MRNGRRLIIRLLRVGDGFSVLGVMSDVCRFNLFVIVVKKITISQVQLQWQLQLK